MKKHIYTFMMAMLSLFVVAPMTALPAYLSYFFAQKAQQVPQTLKIGVIKITGEINTELAEAVIKKILWLQDDTSIKGILLVMNSGGGHAGEFIFREIALLNSVKPVVTLVVNNCCSAAYQIAVGSQWIVAPAEAVIGSIGVSSTVEKHTNVKWVGKEYTADVELEVIHAGKHKVITYTNSPALSDEERICIQERVDNWYRLFYLHVARQRNLSLDNLSEWGDGQVFTGEKALKLGLIDQVGGFSDAVKKLTELIKERNGSAEGKIVFVE